MENSNAHTASRYVGEEKGEEEEVEEGGEEEGLGEEEEEQNIEVQAGEGVRGERICNFAYVYAGKKMTLLD